MGTAHAVDEDAVEEQQLRRVNHRDREVQDENAAENADDRPVPVGQNTCAVGIGHHRSCTLPMMYFFGTKPQ